MQSKGHKQERAAIACEAAPTIAKTVTTASAHIPNVAFTLDEFVPHDRNRKTEPSAGPNRLRCKREEKVLVGPRMAKVTFVLPEVVKPYVRVCTPLHSYCT